MAAVLALVAGFFTTNHRSGDIPSQIVEPKIVADEGQKKLCQETGGTYLGCPLCPAGAVCEACLPCQCPAHMTWQGSLGCTANVGTYRNSTYQFQLTYPNDSVEPLEQSSFIYSTLSQFNICFAPLIRRDLSCVAELYVFKQTDFNESPTHLLGDCMKIHGAKMWLPQIGGIQSQGAICQRDNGPISNVYIAHNGLVYLFAVPFSDDIGVRTYMDIVGSFKFVN